MESIEIKPQLPWISTQVFPNKNSGTKPWICTKKIANKNYSILDDNTYL